MKRIHLKYFVLLFVVLVCQAISKSTLAQTPQKMGYQLLVQNSRNLSVVNQKVGVQISILQNSPTGPALYIETLDPTTNESGLVSIEIGTGNAIKGSFSEIDWSVGPYFIKTETDPTGGTNYSITGTSQLLSVPYALFAKTAENVLSNDYNELINKPSGINNGDILYWNGTGWSVLPIGKTGQILKVSDQNLPEWTDNASNSDISTEGSNSVKAPSITLPILSMDGQFTAITSTSANIGCYIISEGGSPVTERGVCWSPSTTNPSLSSSHSSSGSGGGYFTGTMTGLTPGTTYYVRTYATNILGTGYSTNTLSFPFPVLTTTIPTNIVGTTASSGGNISYYGSSYVISRGVCWSTTANPTIADSKTNNGSGTGSYTSTITGLTPGVTYHVRAYATNSQNTGYGNDYSFIANTQTPPSITLGAIFNITAISGTTSTYIASDGGNPITERGVCYSTHTNPEWFMGRVIDPNVGTGGYNCTITGLPPATLYYVRAYCKNSAGVFYSDNQSFTTLQLNYATITTNPVTSIICTSAVSGGNITNDGNAPVTERGICWGTALNPSISGTHASNGTGTGTFSIPISGLTPGTTYHVRAYAFNAKGYSYGDDIVFNTQTPTVPTLTTTPISSITASSASSGGTITNDGCSSILARGICWSTTNPPYASGNHYDAGIGTGSFSGNLEGLAANTVYYVRAYATNGSGTSYGNLVSFITYPVNIGAPYLGGKLAYILQNSDPGYIALQNHGLIAATSDQSAGAQWGCYSIVINGADGISIGTGNQNMWDIIAGCTENGIAAKICANLVLGIYSDWYLPSKDELYKLYLKKSEIGNFSNNYYWTSSELELVQSAYVVNFNDGIRTASIKNNSFRVRAIRSF